MIIIILIIKWLKWNVTVSGTMAASQSHMDTTSTRRSTVAAADRAPANKKTKHAALELTIISLFLYSIFTVF